MSGFTKWGPTLITAIEELPSDTHSLASMAKTATTGRRNGLPPVRPYIRSDDAEREAAAKATLAGIRRQVGARRAKYARLRRQGIGAPTAARLAGVTAPGSAPAYERWWLASLTKAGEQS
jgi:hypothetical protein